MVKKRFYAMVSLLLVFFSVSCSHFTPKVVETPQFKEWISSGDAPKIIATLPFTNETEVENLDQLVREGFYKHFSVRNFFDIEIKEVDGIIEVLKNEFGFLNPIVVMSKGDGDLGVKQDSIE